jgi:hypothetical protein
MNNYDIYEPDNKFYVARVRETLSEVFEENGV